MTVPRLLGWAAEPSAVSRLFPEEFSGTVYSFIERYAAEAAAGLPADRTLDEKLRQDQVLVEGGSILDLPALVAAEGPLTAAGGSPLTVSVATRLGRHYRVEWRDTLGSQVFALAFPIDHLLLTRQTAEQRETALVDALRALSAVENPEAPETRRAAGPLTVIEGDHMFTPDINTHLYLSPTDSLPVADPAGFPVETLSNIITTAEIPNSLSLNLSYTGLNRDRFSTSIPLNALLRHFRDQGCTLFFGLSEIRRDGRYTCMLMARNAAEGYCHSVRLRLGPETVKTLSGSVDARLTAYIPLSRILSLFDENQ